ncbi:hypothetical protein CR513_10767, partial [Mucuna pruriens]
MFLEKFFSASQTATIRKEICGIRQHSGETLHEYWEGFNKLYASCLHHQISKQILIQYFYEGLTMMGRSMIDAASGGALMDKMPAVARHLRLTPDVDNLRLKNQLTELTSLVRQHAVGQHQPSIATRVCVSNSNSSDSVSSSDNSSPVTNTSNSIEYSSTNNFPEPDQMENNDRTLKELATLDVEKIPTRT